MIPTSIPVLPQSVEVDQSLDQKFRQCFTGAPAAAGGARTKQVPLLAGSLRWGRAGSLDGLRVGADPGVGPEGWPRWSALPSGGVCAGGMRSALLLLPTPCFCSRLFRSGSWAFLVFLYLFVHNLSQLSMHPGIFSPISFFVFCCLRRGVSGCKPCSKGSQVLASLSISIFDETYIPSPQPLSVILMDTKVWKL